MLQKSYNEKCDIWSMGVVFYILLSGTPPFNGDNDRQIMERVMAGNFKLTIPTFKNVSESAKDLIRKMLTYDFNKRISAKECLEHPWFKETEGQDQVLDVNLKGLSSFTVRHSLTA